MPEWRDALINAAETSIAVLDLEGRIVAVNEAWRAFRRDNHGTETTTEPGISYLEVCDAAASSGSLDARDMAAGLRAVLSGQKTRFSLEYECHAPSEKRWFRAVASFLAGAEAVLVSHHAITELAETRRAESAARARFESLLHDVQVGVLLQDATGRVAAANDAAAKLLGMPVDAIKERACTDFHFLGEDEKKIATEEHPVAIAIRSKSPCRDRLVGIERPSGDVVWCLFHAVPHVDEKGAIVDVVCSLTDVTSRRRVEEELRRSEDSLREAGRMANVGGWTLDLRTNELVWSEETCRIHEVPKNHQPTLEEAIAFYAPEAREAIAAAVQEGIESGKPWDLELPFVTAKGNKRWVRALGRAALDDGRAVRLYGSFQDITDRVKAEKERRELEAHLQQAQKLESLGVLAGGIAHDFNNLLTTILGNAELAASLLPPSSPSSANLEAIMTTAQRASDLCNQMLAYSGRGRFIVEPVSLTRLVEDMREMLRMAAKKARLEWHLDPDVPFIRADATQVRQVVMNLVMNASESQDGAVAIRIRTGREAGHVVLEVSDDGKGMDEETRARLFEPFFTTKFQGRGLGMAAVLGIVQGHEGRIDVETSPGKGTRFRVFFPMADDADRPEAASDGSDGAGAGAGPGPGPDPDPNPTPDPSLGASSSRHAGGRILLVDDEEQVRNVGEALLSQLGFEVETAVDGREAIALLERERGRFQGVVLDLTMPVMDGDVTWRAIRKLDRDLPVIVASGFSEQEFGRRFQADEHIRFIQKPYGLDQLRGAFESLMGC